MEKREKYVVALNYLDQGKITLEIIFVMALNREEALGVAIASSWKTQSLHSFVIKQDDTQTPPVILPDELKK